MDPPSEEDVLSLSAHEEWETGDESKASAMDLTSSEFIVTVNRTIYSYLQKTIQDH
jgi:hypothetical protein